MPKAAALAATSYSLTVQVVAAPLALRLEHVGLGPRDGVRHHLARRGSVRYGTRWTGRKHHAIRTRPVSQSAGCRLHLPLGQRTTSINHTSSCMHTPIPPHLLLPGYATAPRAAWHGVPPATAPTRPMATAAETQRSIWGHHGFGTCHCTCRASVCSEVAQTP